MVPDFTSRRHGSATNAPLQSPREIRSVSRSTPEGDADGAEWQARTSPTLVRAVRPLVRAMARLHAVTCDGIDNIPKDGPAILVGNHGMLGYESLLFFERILTECGRLPIGLADRWFFKVPGLRDVLVRLGGAYGNITNGLDALRRGELLVIYPGGARETLKHERDKYRLQWEQSLGFARLAIAAGVPIVPFAAAGVDDAFRVVGHLRGSGQLLMGHPKYDLPVVWGKRGILPRPVPFSFHFGEPIAPPAGARADDDDDVRELHGRAWTRAAELLKEAVARWTATRGHEEDP